MKRWLKLFSAFFACLTLLPLAALCDQTDPRLDELFADLVNAPNPGIAQGVQQEIWTIWFEGPDETSAQTLNQARMAGQSGDLAKATELFNQLIAEYPQYAEAWNQRAILRYLVGDIEGSLSDIDRVIELEPRHFGALSGRGQCYLRQENFVAALDAFEQALDVNPWIDSTARQIQMLKSIVNQQKPI